MARRADKIMPPCVFPGCARRSHSRGYCSGHYMQLHRGEELLPLPPRYAHFTFAGCDHPHESKGLCAYHREQQRAGQPLRPLIRGKGCTVRIEGAVGRVPLGVKVNGQITTSTTVAVIDAEDVPRVEPHRWHLNKQGYVSSTIDGQRVLLHRLIMSPRPDEDIDHIDGDPLNNQRHNLRCVTHAQNMQNRGVRSDSQTGVRGVSIPRQKTPGFKGYFKVGEKRVYLGTFRTIEEA